MEETMEMITWSQLGIHKKPVIRKSPCLKCTVYNSCTGYDSEDNNIGGSPEC